MTMGIVFLALLIVILGIYFLYNPTSKDGFADVEGQAPDLTAELPSAPYAQAAKTAPRMWLDGIREPTTRNRVIELVEDLKGFFAFEAGNLEDTSDPSVTLPLGVAKGDLKTLESEALFLRRNPGVAPNISVLQIQEIEANLDGLRSRARTLRGNDGVVEAQPRTNAVREGFANMAQPRTNAVREGFADAGSQGECVPVSLNDVKSLIGRIDQEITRLGANATTDPVIRTRINNLNAIRSGINTVIADVESGAIIEEEIPVCKSDIDNFLTVLGSGNETKGIPALFQKAGLSNLFPTGSDPETTRQVNDLLEKYGEKLMNGLSAGIGITISTGLKYTSPNEAAAGAAGINYSEPKMTVTNMAPRGTPEVDSTTLLPGYSSSAAPESASAPVAPQAPGFDWKKRAKEICAAIRRRGLDPVDFGCMSPTAEVSDTYDWRSYARMVCIRASATYDDGLPELIGCPDFNWPGWTTRSDNYHS